MDAATANTVTIDASTGSTIQVGIENVDFKGADTPISINGDGTVNLTMKEVEAVNTSGASAMTVKDANVNISVEGTNSLHSTLGVGLSINDGSVTVTGIGASDNLKVYADNNECSAIGGEGSLTVAKNAVVTASVKNGVGNTIQPISGITVTGSQTTGFNQSDNTTTTTVRSNSTGYWDTEASGGDNIDLDVSSGLDKTVEIPITPKPGDKLTVNGIRVEPRFSGNDKPLISADMLIAVHNAQVLADVSGQDKDNFHLKYSTVYYFNSGEANTVHLDTNAPSTWPDDLFAAVSSGAQKPTKKQQALLVAINENLSKKNANEIDLSTFINQLTELYAEFAVGAGQSFDVLAFESELVRMFGVTLDVLKTAWGNVDVLNWLKKQCEEQNAAKLQAVERMLPTSPEGVEQLNKEEFKIVLNDNTVARAKTEGENIKILH